MIAGKLAEQVILIFFLMGVGIWLKKSGMVTYEAARMFSNFVLTLVSPTLLVQIFQRERETTVLIAMGATLILAVLYHVIAALVTRFIYPLRKDSENQRVERLLSISSNCGYMGIPLMVAIMGEPAMLYAAVYIAVFTVYIWTHGIMVITRAKTISIKSILTAPGTIGTMIGVAFFLLEIHLPDIVLQGMSYLTSMNTPLPTIITGIFIADIALKKSLTDWHVYFACAMRLLVLPLLFLGVMWLLRVPSWFAGGSTVALAAMISCSCPGAITTILMPARHGMRTEHGAVLVAMSTLLSIITIPALATLAQWVL